MSGRSGSVRRVSAERWQQAQEWELREWEARDSGPAWRRLARRARALLAGRPPPEDDWNHWWAERFDGYAFLPEVLDNYVELGCGPYTNTRLILEGRRAGHVVCSDPLARRYVRFSHGWLAEQHRAGAVLIDDHPIEECPYATGYFDAVVMVNVLDHVRDADACLEQARRITRTGGVLVVGQELTCPDDLATLPDDVGHPILLQREDVEAHLRGFEPLLHRVLERDQGRNPSAHCATLLFAGRKRDA